MSTNRKPTRELRLAGVDHPPAAERDGDLDPLRSMLTELAVLGDHAGRFASAKADGVRVRIRNLLLRALAGGVVLVLGLTMALSLWFYLIRGIAGGLSVALGDRTWLADLLAGGLGLGALALAAAWSLLWMRRSRRRKRVMKYERRKARRRLLAPGADQAGREVA